MRYNIINSITLSSSLLVGLATGCAEPLDGELSVQDEIVENLLLAGYSEAEIIMADDGSVIVDDSAVSLELSLELVAGLGHEGFPSYDAEQPDTSTVMSTGLVQNGSFEFGVDPGALFHHLLQGSTNIDNWQVGGHGVDYIGELWQAADGGRSIDLSTCKAGVLSQDIETVEGEPYVMLFALAGNPAGAPAVKGLTVEASDSAAQSYQFDITGNTLESMGWVEERYEFTATSSTTTVTFTSMTSTCYGPALDNVRIHRQNLVKNGSFEFGVDPGALFHHLLQGDTNIDDWEVGGHGVDYISGIWQASDGDRSIDLSAEKAGTLSQDIETVDGTTYAVVFDLSGNPAGAPAVKDLTVTASGSAAQNYQFDTTGNTLENMGWVEEHYEFTATSSVTTLTFESLVSNYYGPALDNIRVFRI